MVLALGLPALVAASAVHPHDAAGAATQDWPPFVLVTGLLVVGLVARDDGLFDLAGSFVAQAAKGGWSLFVGAAVLVALVTATLNLDTAVAFLTPVLVVAARRRGTSELPLLYLGVFMANGASLLLPGSNLTNLIVLGSSHQAGAAFAAAMALPWAAAVVVVTVVVGAAHRRSLASSGESQREPVHARMGGGLPAVAIVLVAMLVLPPAGAAVAAIAAGAAAATWTATRRRMGLDELRRTVAAPLLVGLFSIAVALGALGRAWDGPHRLLAHASSAVTAIVGAGASVVVNNLPAASLLAARPPPQAHALLIGLDLGPNLAVSGALSALLWLQVSRTVGARPNVLRYSALGAVVVPLSMAAALGALGLHT